MALQAQVLAIRSSPLRSVDGVGELDERAGSLAGPSATMKRAGSTPTHMG